jgi:hypothetical protein
MTKTAKPLTAKTEAALTAILLALVTAPATEVAEAGELAEYELEAMKGVGLPQLNALVARGLLVRVCKTFVPTSGPYVGTECACWYYSAA